MKVVTRCKQGHETVADSLLLTHQKPTYHCPLCNCHPTSRDYDEYDVLSERYSLPRAISISLAAFIIGQHNQPSVQAYIVERFHLKVSNGYAPLTVHCSSCHSSFRFHMHTPTIQSPPQFCVYCGSSSVSQTTDNELDTMEVLARAYNVTPDMMSMLYAAFCQQRNHTHFADYIASLKEQFKNA